MSYSRHYRLRYHRCRSFFDKVVWFKGTVDSKTTWISVAPSGAQTDRLLNAHSLFGEDRRARLHRLHVTPAHKHGYRCASRVRNKLAASGNCRLSDHFSLKCHHKIHIQKDFNTRTKPWRNPVLLFANSVANIVDIDKKTQNVNVKTTMPKDRLD